MSKRNLEALKYIETITICITIILLHCK